MYYYRCYAYSTDNNVNYIYEKIGEGTNSSFRTTEIAYDADNRISSWRKFYSKRDYTYDKYGRLITQNTYQTNSETPTTPALTQAYAYYWRLTNSSVSNRVYTLTTTMAGEDSNLVYTYTYDANGNIKTVSDGTNKTTYTYDTANQLLREDNQAAGKTWVWTYDDAGNILTKKEYAYTTGTVGTATDTITYGYTNTNWGDLLTSYDGTTISSDTIGNMTSDGTWTYTWEHGRELSSMTNGSTTWNMTYNADGLRTKRTNGSTTYNYVYLGGQLVKMTFGSNTITFNYDASGTPMSMVYNGTTYYYITNLQGDVTGITTKAGVQVVAYTYDAWGRLLSTTGTSASTIGLNNPLRYRGYVYDRETGLYYLQSRYYNPKMGRFISADAFVSTGQGFTGNNMFTYCLNNPMSFVDPAGTLAFPGEIHNEVVRRIAAKYGFYKEQFIVYDGGGFGRADLISQDGQVWDVKRDKPRQVKAGEKQVEKYVNNTWARSPDTPLSIGGSWIEPGFFYHKSGLTTYKVAYKYAGNGVIAYDYRITDFDYQTLAMTAFVVGIGAIAGAVAGLPTAASALYLFG